MAFNSNGYFYTSYNPTELNKKSFAETILKLWPNGSAPIFALTGEAGKTKAIATSHGYFTKTMQFASVTVDDASDLVAGDTTLVVDSTVGIIANMVLQVPATRENVRVVSVDSATQLTIARSFGRVAAGAILDNAILFAVGNVQDEAQTRPASRNITAVYVPNYTSIVRNAWAISNSARASLAEAGYNNVAETKSDCMELHSIDMESQILFGQAEAPSGTPPAHATQGLIDSIYEHAAANVSTAGATTTYAQLVTAVEGAFTNQTSLGNGKERTAFCDATAMKVLTDIGKAYGQVTIDQKETTFGMMFTEFKFYKGVIRLLEHPLLNGLTRSAPGLMIVADLPANKLAYMEGRDVKSETYDGSADGSNSGIDAQGGSLLSEFATEFKNPLGCAIFNGLTAAA